jgi:hypothetical protein
MTLGHEESHEGTSPEEVAFLKAPIHLLHREEQRA